jgi:hypothetical protein
MDRIIFTKDTVIKQEPIPSSDLPSNKRQNVPIGTMFVLQSYSVPPSSQNHYKISLKSLVLKGFGNWFVFEEHADIIDDPIIPVTTVDALLARQTDKSAVRIVADRNTIGTQQGFLKMVFNQDTVIKRRPVDSSVLNDQSKQTIPAGTELVLLTDRPDTNNFVRLPIESGHVKFTLKDLEIKGFSQNWYAFTKHVGIHLVG